jgi:hypothetical protein
LRRAGIENEVGYAALTRLASPEPESRTPDYGGRRMIRIDGGFLILNYDKHRQRDFTGAERAARYRERKRNAVTSASNAVTSVTRTPLSSLPPHPPLISPPEAEAEVEATPPPTPSSKEGAQSKLLSKKKAPSSKKRPLSLAEHPGLRPSVSQVEAEIEKKYPEFANQDVGSVFVAYYSENGWVKLNGRDIYNWKATLFRWIAKRRVQS